jgi:hypothetical protein
MSELDKLINIVEDEDKTIELMMKTPTLKDEIFNTIPDFFKEIVQEEFHGNNIRKKDIMLLSSLSSLSSQFPKIKFYWWDKEYYSNLYFYLAAKTGQGKSMMRVGRELLKIQRDKVSLYNISLFDKYKKDLELYKRDKKNNTKPMEPKEKQIIFGSNISTSALIDQITSTDTSLMFDTESDTMANNMKQDWGDYTTTLNKCAEHEQETKTRVSTINTVIDNPKLSVCISGTLNNAMDVLVSKTEGGLFNRFMTYIFAEETEYIRYYQDDNKKYKSTKDYYGELSIKLDEYVRKYSELDYEIIFRRYDLDVFHKNQILLRRKAKFFEEKDIDGILKRYAIMTLRIATLFTIFRRDLNIMDVPDINGTCKIYGELIDLENAISITEVLLEHSKLLFYTSNDTMVSLKDPNKQQKAVQLIMNKLSDSFTKQELDVLMLKNNISEKTGQRAMKTLKEENYITDLKKGLYQKIKKQNGNK